MKPRIEPSRQRNPELSLAVNETPNGNGDGGRPALLPDRYPTPDLFICDVLDAIPKDDMASMEHPIFSLATKPDRRVFRYEHNGNTVEIVPSVKGLATIHDKDILIYCISQLIAKMNQGEKPSRTLHLTARDLLVWTNRQTDGDGYDRLRSAFERLLNQNPRRPRGRPMILLSEFLNDFFQRRNDGGGNRYQLFVFGFTWSSHSEDILSIFYIESIENIFYLRSFLF